MWMAGETARERSERVSKRKKKNTKLESFTMMKSSNRWDENETEKKYYVKGGERMRK